MRFGIGRADLFKTRPQIVPGFVPTRRGVDWKYGDRPRRAPLSAFDRENKSDAIGRRIFRRIHNAFCCYAAEDAFARFYSEQCGSKAARIIAERATNSIALPKPLQLDSQFGQLSRSVEKAARRPSEAIDFRSGKSSQIPVRSILLGHIVELHLIGFFVGGRFEHPHKGRRARIQLLEEEVAGVAKAGAKPNESRLKFKGTGYGHSSRDRTLGERRRSRSAS